MRTTWCHFALWVPIDLTGPHRLNKRFFPVKTGWKIPEDLLLILQGDPVEKLIGFAHVTFGVRLVHHLLKSVHLGIFLKFFFLGQRWLVVGHFFFGGLESFEHVLSFFIVGFRSAEILDRKKVVDQVSIFIDITFGLLYHGLYLGHFLFDVLGAADFTLDTLGLPEIELRNAKRFRIGVDQALFENKVLVLHKCSNFFFLCNLWRINLLILFLDFKTHGNQLIISFSPNFIIILFARKFDMLVFMRDHTFVNFHRVLCTNAFFRNANENIEHSMKIIVAWFV